MHHYLECVKRYVGVEVFYLPDERVFKHWSPSVAFVTEDAIIQIPELKGQLERHLYVGMFLESFKFFVVLEKLVFMERIG